MVKCDRCNSETGSVIGSFFNTEMICMKCRIEERKHPMFKEAQKREYEEVKKGNRMFEGIGLPDDLIVKGK